MAFLPERRSSYSVESLEEDKTTLWVRDPTSEFPLVPRSDRPLPRLPSDRPSETRALAVSKTLRPMAAGLRDFPFAYVLSMIALAVAGVSLYLARTAPSDAQRAAAAGPVIAAPKPTPPLEIRPPARPAVSAELDRPAASPPSGIVHIPPTTSGRPPIDIMSLPIAPPAGRAKPR